MKTNEIVILLVIIVSTYLIDRFLRRVSSRLKAKLMLKIWVNTIAAKPDVILKLADDIRVDLTGLSAGFSLIDIDKLTLLARVVQARGFRKPPTTKNMLDTLWREWTKQPSIFPAPPTWEDPAYKPKALREPENQTTAIKGGRNDSSK